jgi:hypothetical protein
MVQTLFFLLLGALACTLMCFVWKYPVAAHDYLKMGFQIIGAFLYYIFQCIEAIQVIIDVVVDVYSRI